MSGLTNILTDCVISHISNNIKVMIYLEALTDSTNENINEQIIAEITKSDNLIIYKIYDNCLMISYKYPLDIVKIENYLASINIKRVFSTDNRIIYAKAK